MMKLKNRAVTDCPQLVPSNCNSVLDANAVLVVTSGSRCDIYVFAQVSSPEHERDYRTQLQLWADKLANV